MSDKRMLELILRDVIKTITHNTIILTNTTVLYFCNDANFIGLSDDGDVETLHSIKNFVGGVL